MAEFGFCKVASGTSARHDYKENNAARAKEREEKAKKEEEERQRQAEQRRAEEEQRRAEEEEKKRQEEAERKRKEAEANKPWWKNHVGNRCILNKPHFVPRLVSIDFVFQVHNGRLPHGRDDSPTRG